MHRLMWSWEGEMTWDPGTISPKDEEIKEDKELEEDFNEFNETRLEERITRELWNYRWQSRKRGKEKKEKKEEYDDKGDKKDRERK